MLRHVSSRALLLAAFALLFAAFTDSRDVLAARPIAHAPGSLLPHLKLSPARQSQSDLEVSGLPGAAHAYLTRAELESLPQVSATVADSIDFPGRTIHVTGVLLETLVESVEAPLSLDLVVAICADRYHSHFSSSYIRSHHPILVLSIDHQTPGLWARSTHQPDFSPYLILYDHFVPEYKILAHPEEDQIPTNITELRFRTAAQTFDPIAPPAGTPDDSPIQQGFTIAKQNCLRCHAKGDSGGQKSSLDWNTLSLVARTNPEMFRAFIQNPQSLMPKVLMPPRPDYDAPTLAALTAYFQSMPAAPPSPPRRVTHE